MATCAGHGTAMPPRPALVPDNTCWQCMLPYPPPFVPPPPRDCPPGFTPGAYEDGVLRNAAGHITGIQWGELRGANAHLLRFKDVAVGPGHPLAEGIDPRSFIPSAARGPSPPRLPVKPQPPPAAAAAAAAAAPAPAANIADEGGTA